MSNAIVTTILDKLARESRMVGEQKQLLRETLKTAKDQQANAVQMAEEIGNQLNIGIEDAARIKAVEYEAGLLRKANDNLIEANDNQVGNIENLQRDLDLLQARNDQQVKLIETARDKAGTAQDVIDAERRAVDILANANASLDRAAVETAIVEKALRQDVVNLNQQVIDLRNELQGLYPLLGRDEKGEPI